MLKLGLTGGIGSGKSFVAEEFLALGATIVDADLIARQAVAPGEPTLPVIAQKFGGDILLADGALDRAKLRGIIFSSPDAKQWLEGLLHPLVRQLIVEQLNAAKSVCSLLVSPLLIETRQTELVSKVIVVDVDPATQVARATARDDCDAELIQRIINNQMPREQRLAHADFVIDNSGTKTETARQIQLLHQSLLLLAEANNDR